MSRWRTLGSDPNVASGSSDLRPASKLVTYSWMLVGLAFAAIGAGFSGTWASVESEGEELAGVVVMFFGSLGWAVGAVVACIAGWMADANRQVAGRSRRVLVLILPAVMLVVMLLMGISLVTGFV